MTNHSRESQGADVDLETIKSESEKAYRMSLQIHPPSPAARFPSDDPASIAWRSSVTESVRLDPFDDRRHPGQDSAIDDVISSGTWNPSSDAVTKRFARHDDASSRDSLTTDHLLHQDSQQKGLSVSLSAFGEHVKSQPYAYALGAAGTAFFLARLLKGRPVISGRDPI